MNIPDFKITTCEHLPPGTALIVPPPLEQDPTPDEIETWKRGHGMITNIGKAV